MLQAASSERVTLPNPHEREAAKRQARMSDMEDRVADGSLTIRKMTDAERSKFGVGDPDRPFRRFFVPGARPSSRRGEDEYQRIARQVRTETGDRVTPRRIFRVDCKVKGAKRRLQVGEPAGGDAGTVTAIFELREAKDIVVATDEDVVALRVPAKGADVLEFA